MMTTPQEMSEQANPSGEIPESEGGLLYRIVTKLIAWTLFTGFIAFIAGCIVFVCLALYRGILWIWPGGAA